MSIGLSYLFPLAKEARQAVKPIQIVLIRSSSDTFAITSLSPSLIYTFDFKGRRY